ncbi:serine hydrolase domain-containing protein [Amycolatopsis sp. NPDC049868]|uniref:serine hydrolase domain-containing protein n=1 Tax=Amycolatopsis sp. NPDC049868 TaxID=3363934 RepID=UPI0037A2A777
MTRIQVTDDSSRFGFDPRRLGRIDRRFDRYVEDGVLPGYHIVISRSGEVVYSHCGGYRDRERLLPVNDSTRWRIYSMTKPITSVAAMMLYEEGAFELTDPIGRYLPEFADMRVYTASAAARTPVTVPATEPIRVWHLLTHTAGLTYGFQHSHRVDALYRAAGYDFGTPQGVDLGSGCEAFAGFPLLFNPGTAWNYSVSTDVLGHLLSVISGWSLDKVLAEYVLNPLAMSETGFSVDEDAADDLAAMYLLDEGSGRVVRGSEVTVPGVAKPDFLSGGGGLISTAHDYQRFTQMLLRGGELDGIRLLGPRTVDYMTQNHLPGGSDLRGVVRSGYGETGMNGVGFGLGFSVVLDPMSTGTLGTAGEFAWGGAANTIFWVDPVEELTVLFFTQVLPGSALPIRPLLKQLVYQALVG